MAGKCFATVLSRKCSKVVLLTDLVSTSYTRQTRQFITDRPDINVTDLIDAANSETEGTTLDTGAVHIVSN